MSMIREAWQSLHAIASTIDKLADLQQEVLTMREEQRQLRDRIIRLETQLDVYAQQAGLRRLSQE